MTFYIPNFLEYLEIASCRDLAASTERCTTITRTGTRTGQTGKNDKGEVCAMRCHRAAIRQAIKAFLRDLWIEWRTYEGYTIPESYAEAHLGMAPHGYNEADMRPVE